MSSAELSIREIRLYNQALALSVFTILYNLAEGVIATWLGYADETLALFGFGVDSFIEVLSGVGILHMVIRIRHHPDQSRDRFERKALKITGTAFYLLTIGLGAGAVLSIYTGRGPETTFWGVVIALVSIVVMLLLIYGKQNVGRKLNSEAILADSSCTRICIYMSLVLLLASALHELTRVPYVDAAGSLGLAWFSLKEGKECFQKAAGNHPTACSC